MPVISTRRYSTTGSSSYLPPSIGGTTSSLANLGKTTTSSGYSSSTYRSNSLSNTYSTSYSSGIGSGTSSSSSSSYLSRPSYRSGLYSSSSSLGGSTRTSSYLTGGNNDSTATLSSRFGVSNYKYTRSSSDRDTITSTRGLTGKTHFNNNNINNNNINYNNTNTSTTTTTTTTSIATGLKSINNKTKTIQTKPPIGTFSKRQSLRENRSRDNSTTRPLSIPDISKIGVTSKSDSDCNANNSSKFTSSLSSSTSTGNEDRGNKRSISSSLSSSSLALQVATSALDLQEKYSPAYYIPKCELSRSRSLSEATPNSISNDHNLTNSSSNVSHLLQQKEYKEQHQEQQVADDIDCVYKPKSSSPSLSSISASKDNSSSQTVNKVNIQLCDAADPASSILATSTNNYLNHIKVYDCSAFIKNTISTTNNNYSLHVENPVKTKNDANALYLTDCNATYTPFAERSKSYNINSNDAINNSQVNSIVRKAVDAIRANTISNNTTATSTITKTIATNLTTTTITTTTIATKTKSTITKNVAAKYMKNSSVSLGEELKGNYIKTHDEQNSESNESTTSCKINKLKDSHSHIIKTIDNNEILGKLLPSTSTQNTMKKGQQSNNSTNQNDGNIIDSLNKPSSASSCSSNTSSSSSSSAVPSKTQNSITNSIKFKIPNPSNNSIIQAAKLNLKSTKQYLSSKFDDKLIINSSYSYNLKTTNNCNKNNLKNNSKKCETIVTTNSSPSVAVSKITKSFFSSNCGNQNQNNLNLNNKKKNCANDNSNSQNFNSTSKNDNNYNKSNFLTTTNKNNLSDSHLEFSKNKQRPSGSCGGVTSYGGVIGGNKSQTHIHSYSVGGYVPSSTSVSKIDDKTKTTVNKLSGTANLKNVNNTNNNNNTSSLIKNFGNDNNTKNNNRSLNNSPFFSYHSQITSTFRDENFLKREYELARSQVIGSTETKRKDDDQTTIQKLDEENSMKIEQINSNHHLNNSQNKYSKKLIKPLVHKTTNNKFTAKLAKIMTNNNMNCMQNNHEILDDIKFIDSDDTDRSNQQQQQQQQQQTKLNSINETIINPYRNNQETSSVSSSSSSPMNVRKDMNLVNNKNMIISSHNSSSLYLSKVKNTGVLSTSSSTNKDELLSENRKIDATSTLTNKFSSLTDLKRAPQSIRSSQSNSNNYCSSSSTSIRNVDNSRKFNFISKTNIRQVVSSSSTISTATMSMATTTTTTSIKHPVSSTTVAPSAILSSSPSSSVKSSSVVMINNYSNNISSSRDSTPSNSPQFLRRRNYLNSSNNTGINTSSYITKHSSQQEINEILPSIASTTKSTTTVSSASASSILTDKNMSNKLCDIEESVRNTSIRSALPSSPTLSRYWDREGRSAISSRNISDGDDYAATKSSVFNSSESYDKIPSEQREGLCGLRNIGNTCFMNSVIQCLSHTRELTKFLKNQVRLKSTSKDEQILYEFAKLIREMWSPNTRSVTPHELKSAFSSKHRMYSGYNQQDAQEFLRFFLDSLHCALNTGAKADQLNIDESLSDNKKADLTWEHYSKIENSVIKDLFVGQLKSSLKCTTCGNTSVTFDPFWDLSVPLPSSSRCKLDACLDFFIREEVLDGDEMPTCAKCQTRRKCTKRFTIQRFPKYLVIHLKRFSETRWSKLSNIVEFPTGEKELNMSPYASTSSSNSLYSLYGISNHMGSTAGGHYVALCKHPVTKKWHEFNDNVVSDEVSENILVSSSAYLLFYERA